MQRAARLVAPLEMVVSLGAAVAAGAEAGGGLRVRVETGIAVPMRDGVTLLADVYRPDAEGRFDTLLQRTPYDRKGGTTSCSACP